MPSGGAAQARGVEEKKGGHPEKIAGDLKKLGYIHL